MKIKLNVIFIIWVCIKEIILPSVLLGMFLHIGYFVLSFFPENKFHCFYFVSQYRK